MLRKKRLTPIYSKYKSAKDVRVIMDEETKKALEDFVKLCYGRLDTGSQVHGSNYEKLDLYKEISDELADVANYAFMEYYKIQKLKIKKEQLNINDNNSSA